MVKKLVLILALVGLLAGCAPAEPGEPAVEAPVEESPVAEAAREPLVIEEGKLYLAIIWHQHQPVYYKDPETGIYQRPWVRVHASKDYVDMAAILRQYPDIHATFNLTPSLIRQLDDLAAGAKDLYQVYTEIPAEELTDDDKAFILSRFFDTNGEIIARFPRYLELSEMRGGASAEQIDAAIASWTADDFRDLQVLFNLAWTDPDWLAEEPLAALVAKGSGFSEEDKAVVLAEHLRLIQEVIPLHAAMQESGQIEVTMTPYAHPILPLLTDSNLAAVALPEATLPDRFVWGQDAQAQVDRGVEFYTEHFGVAPRGMWPAEGSVAQEVVTMIAKSGVGWIATDEMVLEDSLPGFTGFTRDSSDTVQQADELYQPYLVQGSRGDPVAIIFRDHVISDKVGFEYSGTPGGAAAADFIARMKNIQAQLDEEGAEGPHLVTVLLDGENAWEYYENDGKEFLNELYSQLSEEEDIVTVTPSEYLDALAAAGEMPDRIDDLFPGSWIDGTFSTWIGEDEENLAWQYLARVRQDVQDALAAGSLDEAATAEVMDLVYIAEGSDWFWWYGADQNSGADGDFDAQFRAYLAQIYDVLGQEAPDFVSVPVIPQVAEPPAQEPLGLLAVTVDGVAGEEEWADAGYYTLEGDFTGLYYGFDGEGFNLRLDAAADFTALEGRTFGFYFTMPSGTNTNATTVTGQTQPGFGIKRLIEVTFDEGAPAAFVYKVDGAGGWEVFDEEAPALSQVASAGATLELRAPFAEFVPDLRSGDRLTMRLVVSEEGEDIYVAPVTGPATAAVPDLPIPNVVFELADPIEDDDGPGSYTYPTDGVFKPGVFDIADFTVGYDDEAYIFRLTMRGPVANEWGSPNGLSIQTVDVYIDVDGPGAGDRMLLPGRNAALTADFAWDYALWAEGWTPQIVTPGPEGPVDSGLPMTIVTNPGARRITLRVPKSALPGDPSTWHFAVAVMSQEGYPAAGVWRIREVQLSGEQWRIGGGTGAVNDTRIMDILWPEGLEGTQGDFLAPPATSVATMGELTPDDVGQMPMFGVE